MLTFFATLFVNILVGTIFYLIISLKLEKTSSGMQSKKMRREMDDMIRDFNLTAERNISLLERKIEVMKRLLEKHGIEHLSDLKISPDEMISRGINDIPSVSHEMKPEPRPALEKTVSASKGDDAEGIFRKLGQKLFHTLQGTDAIQSDMPAPEVPEVSRPGKKEKTRPVVDVTIDERVNIGRHRDAEQESPSKVKSADIRTAFTLAGDRKEVYELLSYYYDNGTSIEELSRISGVPVGEIQLVVSLAPKK